MTESPTKRERHINMISEWLADYFEQGYSNPRYFQSSRPTMDLPLKTMEAGEALSHVEKSPPNGFIFERDKEQKNRRGIRWKLEKIDD